MIDFFYSIDLFFFRLFNGWIGNPVFDTLMPVITDINRTWWGWVLIGGVWTTLLWRGGARGRTAGFLLIPLIVLSDQLSSSVLKPMFARARPCHIVDGSAVVEHIRLLVGCGGGYSFPSSHAVNNFAAAAFFSYFYPGRKHIFWTAAGLMAFSRISVGVHYPSDIIGGGLLGIFIAMTVIVCWNLVVSWYPSLDYRGVPASQDGGRSEGT